MEMLFEYSANFLIKEYGSGCSAVACLEVSGWGVGEYTGLVKREESNPSSKYASYGHSLSEL